MIKSIGGVLHVHRVLTSVNDVCDSAKTKRNRNKAQQNMHIQMCFH